jgi:hypothetical protein
MTVTFQDTLFHMKSGSKTLLKAFCSGVIFLFASAAGIDATAVVFSSVLMTLRLGIRPGKSFDTRYGFHREKGVLGERGMNAQHTRN